MDETRRAWDEVQAHWHASPLGQQSTADRVVEFVRSVVNELDTWPADQVIQPLCTVAEELFQLDDVENFKPAWTAIEGDPEVA
ncbi:MAG: hypothetical protein ABW360_13700, partial [Phenylobacterium sp.]